MLLPITNLCQVEAHEQYLSELWMSAIRDHALLSLPPSFATQLPPNGGTFYCADTIDSSRPHYKRVRSWCGNYSVDAHFRLFYLKIKPLFVSK